MASAKVVELSTPEQLKTELAKPGPGIVLLYSAPWCPGCQLFHPVYEKLSEKMKPIRFYDINIDVTAPLKEHEGMVPYIPTAFVGHSEDQLRNRPCRILNDDRDFDTVREEIEECLRSTK